MKFLVYSSLLASLFASVAAGAETPSERNLATVYPARIYDFAQPEVPGNILTKNGSVELSRRHALLRGQSLRWSFRAGGTLTLDQPVPYFTPRDATKSYKRPAICAFSAWIYNETPHPGATLRFEFGNSKKGKPDTWFDYQLNFKGWRAVQVAYGRDMEGKPQFDMNYVRLVAPANVKAGTLWLDAIIPAVILDDRHIDPDHQQPFIRKAGGGDSFDSPLNADKLPELPLLPLTDADRQGFRLLTEKLCQEIEAETPIVPLDRLKREYDALKLQTSPDNVITGNHVSYNSQTDTLLMARRLPEYRAEIVELRQYGILMQQIAAAYRAAKNPQDKEQLGAMFLTMARHLFDQGFVDGSIRGTSHHFGYSSREFFASFLLMRELLEQNHLLTTASGAGIWYNALRFLRDQSKMPPPNADIFNTLTRSSLIALALMPDTPEKAAMLRAFQTYYGRNIAMDSPGQTGGFKADGSIFHHWGHYPGYGFPALNGAALACDMLDKTPWAMPEAARAKLALALKSAYIYTNPRLGQPATKPETATALCGRHPFGEAGLHAVATSYRRMAADSELAAIYKRLRPDDRSFADVKPAELPQGDWSFNYGCFGIHRFGSKMVTLKGYNRTVWSSEIYRKDNRFGRYQSNGAIEIIPQGEHRQEGWDWNRIPGTTSLYRPLDVLDSPSPHTLMLTSDSRMSGSSNLRGKFGMFAVELTEPARERFDAKFHAVKSVFAFGKYLVALGSDIRAGSEYPVETTLFQYPSSDGKYPVWFDSTVPVSSKQELKKVATPAWTADDFGNAWFVFSPGELELSRKLQHSRHNKTSEPTSGEFTAVRLAHGVRPDNASYEYLIDLDITPEAAAQAMKLWKNPAERPYRVLSQNSRCHAIYEKAGQVTAAVFFRPGTLPGQELLKKALTPGYVMLQPENGKLFVSLNTPDLTGFLGRTTDVNYTGKAESEPRRVTILLKGRWRATAPQPGVELKQNGTDTEISAWFRHGIAKQLYLSAQD